MFIYLYVYMYVYRLKYKIDFDIYATYAIVNFCASDCSTVR